jgi:hypothetical protein
MSWPNWLPIVALYAIRPLVWRSTPQQSHSLAARLGDARLVEQGRFQSAGSASFQRRLRCFKIIPLAHSSDRADVLAHNSDGAIKALRGVMGTFQLPI